MFMKILLNIVSTVSFAIVWRYLVHNSLTNALMMADAGEVLMSAPHQECVHLATLNVLTILALLELISIISATSSKTAQLLYQTVLS